MCFKHSFGGCCLNRLFQGFVVLLAVFSKVYFFQVDVFPYHTIDNCLCGGPTHGYPFASFQTLSVQCAAYLLLPSRRTGTSRRMTCCGA